MRSKVLSNINIYLICFCLFPIFSIAQISLPNPSFEDEPADATTPMGWYPCEAFTTPDILPGFWGVYNESADGNTYVGLITRQDGSFESISTIASAYFEKDICYQMNLSLAHSRTYSGYNKPLSLKIWIGKEKCMKNQLIHHSPVIDHGEWKKYFFQFSPEANYQYIIIEAFYKPSPFSYKGNILIDDISSIMPCNKV